MLVIIISTLVICAAGIAAAYFFGVNKIAWWRRLLGLAGFVLATSLVGFGSFGIASNIAYESAIQGYHEFLNGTVVEATVEEIICTKDGPCTYEYDCDPETVTEYYTDSEGELKSRTKTEWDSCPYATVEYSYHTKDSLGRTTGFDRAFAEKPVEWRIGSGIPGGVPRGAPEAWQKARTALDAGRGLPMTTTNTYTNYILASDSDLLKESSDDIETLLEAGLLPEHTQNMKDPIMDTFSANKVNFVGFTPKDEAAWQESVMQFNAALGM